MKKEKPGVVAHDCSPSTREAEAKECFRDQAEQRDSLLEREWAGGEEEKENGGRGEREKDTWETEWFLLLPLLPALSPHCVRRTLVLRQRPAVCLNWDAQRLRLENYNGKNDAVLAWDAAWTNQLEG